MIKSVSPSRRYVAMCSRRNFEGYYFRSFTLPETDPWSCFGQNTLLENSSSMASWYFLNRLNIDACIEGCVTEEDFRKVREEMETFKRACDCGATELPIPAHRAGCASKMEEVSG